MLFVLKWSFDCIWKIENDEQFLTFLHSYIFCVFAIAELFEWDPTNTMDGDLIAGTIEVPLMEGEVSMQIVDGQMYANVANAIQVLHISEKFL